jgi:hypothetical protein
MDRRPPHVVSTIDLPSGKILEVVQPAAGEPYTRVKAAVPAEDRDLCICERCSSELVEPVEWEAAGAERWRVALDCPDCGYWTEGVFSQECVDRFDERLDEGTAVLVEELKRLQQVNMAEDVERFIGALRAGAILPEDFQTPDPGSLRR